MKLRIIKEKGVYRIQEQIMTFNDKLGEMPDGWKYAEKATNPCGMFSHSPINFKTQEDAEKFIEHNYIVKIVKEYEVE